MERAVAVRIDDGSVRSPGPPGGGALGCDSRQDAPFTRLWNLISSSSTATTFSFSCVEMVWKTYGAYAPSAPV